MPHRNQVKDILASTLGIQIATFDPDAPLLGSVPELDSMAVIGVISALEQQFGIVVEDDEISARHFATMGSLAEFVRVKLAS